MPDKWEYPWFAAWDLAFHAIAAGLVDIGFAKQQLDLLLSRRYLHPNGQIPAYEWNFSDVNPPVHAWAAYLRLRAGEGAHRRRATCAWLENAFQKLVKNFTWWVNRKDADGPQRLPGRLPRPGQHRRLRPQRAAAHRRPPRPGRRHRVDGAVLPEHAADRARAGRDDDPVYLEQAQTFFEHFAWIAVAMNRAGSAAVRDMWDEEDGFFYDVLRLPDGTAVPGCKVRSMVGLLPLAAATVISDRRRRTVPRAGRRRAGVRRPASERALAGVSGARLRGHDGRRLLALFDEPRLRRVLARMLDEEEFLSPYGIRSLSRYHPTTRTPSTSTARSTGCPTCRRSPTRGMFGGNSNWRGPVWFPMNALLIRALLNLYVYYGDEFTVECPTGSGQQMTLFEVAAGDLGPADPDLPAGRRRPPARSTAARRCSRPTRTGATC